MSRKTGLFLLCISVIIIFLISNLCLSPFLFKSSKNINKELNVKIKELVLSSLIDRYSFLEPSVAVNYDEQHFDRIIQLTQPREKDSFFCIINYNFMDTITVEDDYLYRVKVKMYYPENYYHEFSIENKNNEYFITGWELDI